METTDMEGSLYFVETFYGFVKIFLNPEKKRVRRPIEEVSLYVP
jgi:hypothetical protein